MSFKPFFVHRHWGAGKMPNRHPRGFTLYVQPTEDSKVVLVGTAWCSPKDQFCKKTGRSQAQAAQGMLINKREVPFNIAINEFHCGLSDMVVEANWNYIYKYLL